MTPPPASRSVFALCLPDLPSIQKAEGERRERSWCCIDRPLPALRHALLCVCSSLFQHKFYFSLHDDWLALAPLTSSCTNRRPSFFFAQNQVAGREKNHRRFSLKTSSSSFQPRGSK